MTETKKKPQAKKSGRLFSRRALVRMLILVGLALFIGSFVAFILLVRNKPENVFEGMLNNNFRTTSATRTVKQDGSYQKLEQVMRIQSGSQHVIHGYTKLSQAGGGTTIITESIGLPDVEYIRYKSIETNQKGSKGQELDFGGALNVWAKNEPNSDDQLSGLYQDVTLGNAFLFADLNLAKRSEMIRVINDTKVYDVDYNNVQKTWQDGRLKYVYKLEVNPQSYIAMLKLYGEEIGLTQLAGLNPDVYKNADPIKFKIVVDVLSQRLERAESGNGAQTYGGYGIIENVEIPTEAIPATELQQRLSESAGV